MYVKMIFIGTEKVHYLKSDLISKINFIQTKEKRYNPALLLPETGFLLVQSLLVILLVKNSESKQLVLHQLCKLKRQQKRMLLERLLASKKNGGEQLGVKLTNNLSNNNIFLQTCKKVGSVQALHAICQQEIICH